MRSELGFNHGCSAKSIIITRIKELAYRPTIGVARVLVLNIGTNQTGVDRQAPTTNQAFVYAKSNRRLKRMEEQIVSFKLPWRFLEKPATQTSALG